jgi:hypothetical protein
MTDTSIGMKGTLKGKRTNCFNGRVTEVDLDWELKEGLNSRIFQLHGGPTGYESFYLDDALASSRWNPRDGWCACAGTKDSWDKLDISAEEMTRVLNLIPARSDEPHQVEPSKQDTPLQA